MRSSLPIPATTTFPNRFRVPRTVDKIVTMEATANMLLGCGSIYESSGARCFYQWFIKQRWAWRVPALRTHFGVAAFVVRQPGFEELQTLPTSIIVNMFESERLAWTC